MRQSIYAEYIAGIFPQLVTSIVEKLNDKNTTTLTYLYRDLLTKQYSADGRWASILAEYTRVAADVVAMDSSLPVKSRDSLEVASGDIPKMGMELYLTEKQMSDIDAMIAQGLPLDMVVNRIFADTPRAIEGIYERLEDMFLSGLSTGVALSPRNEGTGVRVSYGYRAANQFGVAAPWNTAATVKTIDDIQKVIDKADEDGNTITHLYADDFWLKNFYASEQAKQAYAFEVGFVGNTIPNLGFQQAQDLFQRRFGIQLHRVNRSIKTEINGKKNTHKPWKEGVGVFTCDDVIGSLVWAQLAEARRPVQAVQYQTADDFILLSKFSKVDPLREYTLSQARVVPVINNVDRIYTLDAKTVQE